MHRVIQVSGSQPRGRDLLRPPLSFVWSEGQVLKKLYLYNLKHLIGKGVHVQKKSYFSGTEKARVELFEVWRGKKAGIHWLQRFGWILTLSVHTVCVQCFIGIYLIHTWSITWWLSVFISGSVAEFYRGCADDVTAWRQKPKESWHWVIIVFVLFLIDCLKWKWCIWSVMLGHTAQFVLWQSDALCVPFCGHHYILQSVQLHSLRNWTSGCCRPKTPFKHRQTHSKKKKELAHEEHEIIFCYGAAHLV